MTVLICSLIGLVLTLYTNILSPLTPYNDTLIEYVKKLADIVQHVYKVFDMVNFLIPIDVILLCVEVNIGLYMALFLARFFKWLVERVTDLIP